MLIKNTGTKIVNIGTTALMPDAEMTVSDAVAATPAIKALVKRGNLTLTAEAKTTAKAATTAKPAVKVATTATTAAATTAAKETQTTEAKPAE